MSKKHRKQQDLKIAKLSLCHVILFSIIVFGVLFFVSVTLPNRLLNYYELICIPPPGHHLAFLVLAILVLSERGRGRRFPSIVEVEIAQWVELSLVGGVVRGQVSPFFHRLPTHILDSAHFRMGQILTPMKRGGFTITKC